MFQILHRDDLARIGQLIIDNKKILTPALLPVIHPFIKDPWMSFVKELGFEGIITNSYILYKNGFRDKDIHSFLNFDGLIMTDSGTFQDFVYGGIDATNEEIIKYQESIGSDIITIRDVFSRPDETWESVEQGVEETFRRGLEAKKLTDKYIALPIQGGIYSDLRSKSARLMGSIDNEYFPIGGIVPLMENYDYSSVVDSIILSKMELRTNSVIHAFGAGHPMFFSLLVLSGADVFDSSAYIKYARDNRIMTNEGTYELKFITDELPSSKYLDNFTANELRSLDENKRIEIIAKHNLYVSLKEIKRIREEIKQENLWNYVEYKVRSHPLLIGAYRTFLKYYDFLEKFESRSKRSPVFYTGNETFERPLIKRFIQSQVRPESKGIKIIKKPYSYYYGPRETVVETPFGNLDIYIDETYPVAQSVFPDETYQKDRNKGIIESEEWMNFLKNKINYIFKYQFGIEIFSIINREDISLRLSKNTGKVRNVYFNGNLILSLRAEDGLFSLAYEGAKLLHNNLNKPKMRVVVDKEISQFIKEGKNVFSKFVVDVDDSLRPGDEVIIVDQDDNFLSFGRALLSPIEMRHFKYGVAVKNRIKSKDFDIN